MDEKITTKKKRVLAAIGLTLSIFLIASPAALGSAEAAKDDGQFCIGASSDEGAFTGKYGAAGCGEIAPIPTAPLPDLAVAGLCALPDADRTVYALNNTTRTIDGYLVDDNGQISSNGWSLPVQTGSSTQLNSLALSPLGEFYLTDGGRPLRVDASTGSASSISSLMIGAIAGEAMVYKGVQEFYLGSFSTGALSLYRVSSVEDRSGLVVRVPLPDAPGANGDLGFDQTGDLRVLVSSGATAGSDATATVYTLAFSEFADLPAGTGASATATRQSASFSAPAALNGVAYLNDGTSVASWNRAAAPAAGGLISYDTDGRELSAVSALGVSDLASCGGIG